MFFGRICIILFYILLFNLFVLNKGKYLFFFYIYVFLLFDEWNLIKRKRERESKYKL